MLTAWENAHAQFTQRSTNRHECTHDRNDGFKGRNFCWARGCSPHDLRASSWLHRKCGVTTLTRHALHSLGVFSEWWARRARYRIKLSISKCCGACAA